MPVAPLRWGIVATGNISTAFTRDLAELPDAEVVAVASRTAESANRFSDEFGIPHRHASYGDLVADDDVDIIYIGTPHPQHYAVARASLTAGKAVLCEKPVTLNARQARDLIDTAAAHGVLFAEAMWMRTNPVVRALFDDLAKGTIGEPLQVIADFGFQSADIPPRLLEPELGGGALLDMGVYPATFAYAALGRPDEVKAVAEISDLGVDLNTAMVWRYAAGAVAALTCGMRAQSPGTAVISGKQLSPAWSPPEEVRRDKPSLPSVIPGGSPGNPMGAAAMTLSGGGEYAIHGTNDPRSIGGFVSYGCIRMYNADVLDLYNRVSWGTTVVVTR